ncbi:MAG: hypothetical protein M9908_01120 [Phyllobacteriaceae bacterium]|nr:hypothetical protein [Phyllobacteriaceae bacterium]
MQKPAALAAGFSVHDCNAPVDDLFLQQLSPACGQLKILFNDSFRLLFVS